ncbi:MAG: hypothetical protein E4H03_09930 [Myxococcales bacterium]|nr:MAG: hypothetical protein E4H03_09930 [Myxococcales bacterium]
MPAPLSRYRAACDSIVALPGSTRRGVTVFAKNSDRMPAEECQPLLQIAATDYAPGSTVRCQYIEIDQVAHTHAVLLSRPYWLWGGEHGVNEHGLAIGNHTIFAKDAVADRGLLGMDLVRLALERSEDAAAAVDLIIELIERHGQGGSGFVDSNWPYHNSFLVADARAAWLLEASAGNWACKEVERTAAGTNHTTIGTDWTRASAGCRAHAEAEGWLVERDGRLDFAASYRDTSAIPAVVSSGRYRVSTGALAAGAGELDVAGFKRIMRDHYAAGDVYVPGAPPEDERFFCLCRHDVAGPTTASMVVELADPEFSPLLCRVSLCNPCTGVYLPVFPAGRVPVALQSGSRDRSEDSAWWRFKALLERVETNYATLGPRVRDYWQPVEEQLELQACALRAQLGPDRSAVAVERMTVFMEEMWCEISERLDDLATRLE